MSLINKNKRVQTTDFGDLSQDNSTFLSCLKSFSTPKERTLVRGTVVYKTNDKVWIEVNGVKSEGVIYIEEFNVRGLGQTPEVGDNLEVWLQSKGKLGNQSGTIISFVKGAQIRSWKSLEASYKNKKPVDGIILGSSTMASGYIVSIMPYAARAFLPISQLDQNTRTSDGIQRLKSELHPYFIVRMDRGGSITVSRKYNV